MLAEEIDFHEIFKIHPTAMALVTADFVFVDVNDEFLVDTHRSLTDLVGQKAFAVFPKVPSDPGNPKWTALEAAMTSGKREVFELTRYDIENPRWPGVYEERYWCSTVTPVRGADGQVELLEWSAREVTPIIKQFLALRTEG